VSPTWLITFKQSDKVSENMGKIRKEKHADHEKEGQSSAGYRQGCF
jgi:hypothetical protein